MSDEIKNKPIEQIEDFANYNDGVRLLAYDPVAKKTGKIPLGRLTGTTKYGGARWRKDSASPEGEPFGEIDMIVNMKNILQLGGYLVQNDHSRRKLSSTNHFKLDRKSVV